jgi:SAM-dependent methyltransferase
MTPSFRDHFASAAPAYAAFRPRYPAPLFAALADCAPGRHLAWDCATGSGQAAIGLAEHFAEVVATDASAAQLAAALAHPRVRYRQAPADASGLAPQSVELVTVAQALHWLDRPAFYAEARRVLAPAGVVAVWCYGLLELGPGLDEPIRAFYEQTVGPYWPPERALVDSGYRTVDFPFAELALPSVAMQAELTLAELGGYLGTWSAVLRYRAARGHDPVPSLLDRLAAPWGGPERRRTARWPLAVRAGRVAP